MEAHNLLKRLTQRIELTTGHRHSYSFKSFIRNRLRFVISLHGVIGENDR